MGNTIIINKANVAINFGLLVVTPFWMANNVKPGHEGTFNNIGCVWYSVEVLPWYGPPSEINLGINSWDDYASRFDEIKKNMSKTGSAELNYFKLIGHNLTENEIEERLNNLAFWQDGVYACGKTYCVNGGPSGYAVKGEHVLDITDNFDAITVTECNPTMSISMVVDMNLNVIDTDGK